MTKGKIKVHSLTGRITPQLMNEAWRAVRRNRGAAGIDKVSVKRFELNLAANLDRLQIEGTHYEGLEAALEHNEDEEGWMA